MWGLRTIWNVVGGRGEWLPEWGKLTRAEGAPRPEQSLSRKGNVLGTNLNPRESSLLFSESPGSLLWRKLGKGYRSRGGGVLHQINRAYLQL